MERKLRSVCRLDHVKMSDSTVIEALRAAGPVKEVARAIGRSPRTVERWRQGYGEPSASVMFAIMRWSRKAASTCLQQFTTDYMDAEEARLRAELTALGAMRGGDAKTAAPAGATGGWDGVERRATRVASAALSLSRNLR
jgi:transcriptional regulator with XRE-family HTH domain